MTSFRFDGEATWADGHRVYPARLSNNMRCRPCIRQEFSRGVSE